MRLVDTAAQASNGAVLSGGGRAGELMRAHDWTTTPLGPPEDWPQSLRTTVDLMLASKHAMCLAWGPELTFFYNDAYAPILGLKRPTALGRPFKEVWSDVWEDIEPLVEQALSGEALWFQDLHLVMDRNGYPEDTWWQFSYSPVRDDDGQIVGMLNVTSEMTGKVLAEKRLAATAERQRRLFEKAPGFITVLNGPEHVFEFANAAYRRLIGGRDPTGQTVREALPELEGQEFFELLDQVYATGKRFVAQRRPIRLENASGQFDKRVLDFIYEPVTDDAGQVTGIFVEGHDVTDAHWAETELRDNEARLRMVIDGASDYAIITFDSERRITSWSAGAKAAFGGTEAERLGRPADEIFTSEDRSEGAPEREVATAARDGFPPDVRWHQHRDGPRVFMNGVLRPLPAAADGSPQGFIKIARDETAAQQQTQELIRTREALGASEARFQAIVNSIDQMIWSTRADGYHDFYNQRWYDYTGVPKGSTDGEAWGGLFHPDDHDHAWALCRHSLETGEPYHIEYRLRHHTGQYRWVLGRAQCLRDASGGITRWFGTCTDIQEIVEARDVLARSREELEHEVVVRTRERNRVWEMSRDLFAIMGFDGYLKAINPAWQTTLGRDTKTLLSLSFRDQVHPDDHASVGAVLERLLRGETVERFEDRLRHEDGSWRWISWTLVPEDDVFYAVGRDVTAERDAAAELEAAQEALRQGQKMEAMGQLTGGVAHDFNNLLTPIVGGLDMLQRKGLGSEREQRLIAGAMQSAERAKTLVQRLLAFARRQPLQPSAVDIERLVKGMADLLASTTGPQVRVIVDVADDLPPAQADANQLEMALLNLGVNARDAMPEGGTLRISVNRESVRTARDNLKRGHYVRLSVADTGTGMDQTTLARAVEPFF